jgi:hypothetical protein
MITLPASGISSAGFIPVNSYLHHMAYGLPILLKGPGETTMPVPASIEVPIHGETRKLFLIGLDPGNSAAKAAMYSPDGRIVTISVPAVVADEQELAAGTPATTYYEHSQAGEEPKVGRHIGEDAILFHGRSLPTGSTRERLSDPRYLPYLLQVIIELFLKAGYPPGDYDLLVAFGARNQELRETAGGTELDPPTKAAIDAHFLGRTRRFMRRSKDGDITSWSLITHEVVPGPQSYAGFHLWQKRPDGMPAQDIVHRVVDLDFGAFDLYRLVIDCAPGHPVTATRERVGDGMMIDLIQPFASALKNQFGIDTLDDALALKWFLSGHALVGGFAEDVTEIVQQVRAKQVPAIIAHAFQGARRATDFYRMKGGGVILMRKELEDKMTDLGRKRQTYLLMHDPALLTAENAAGLLSILDLLVRIGS